MARQGKGRGERRHKPKGSKSEPWRALRFSSCYQSEIRTGPHTRQVFLGFYLVDCMQPHLTTCEQCQCGARCWPGKCTSVTLGLPSINLLYKSKLVNHAKTLTCYAPMPHTSTSNMFLKYQSSTFSCSFHTIWHCPSETSGAGTRWSPVHFRVLSLVLWIHETFGTNDHWMRHLWNGGSMRVKARACTAGGC